MAVMGKLRDLYAAADYSVAFLEAAIRKAGIHVAPVPAAHTMSMHKPAPVTTVDDLVDAGRRLDMVNAATTATPTLRPVTLTPPPDSGTTTMHALEKQHHQRNVTDEEVARRLETFLASTPPDSDHEHVSSITISQESPAINIPASTVDSHAADAAMNFTKWSTLDLSQNTFPTNINHHQDDEMLFSSLPLNNEFDDFDQLLNLDAVGEAFNLDDATLDYGSGFGGNGGMPDVDWLGPGNDFTVES